MTNQLSAKGNLKYYSKRNGQEIDFVLDDSIGFEMKATPAINDVSTLQSRCKSAGLTKSYVIGLQYTNPDFKEFVWAGSI